MYHISLTVCKVIMTLLQKIYADLYFSSIRRGGGPFNFLEYETRLEQVSLEDAPEEK